MPALRKDLRRTGRHCIKPLDAIDLRKVETNGLEPSTPGLQSRCSPN